MNKQNQHYHERGNLKNYSRQQRNQIRCLSFYRLEQQLNLVTDYSEIQHISSLLEEARQNLEEAEQRWMELSEKSES